jgi:hypothetical protein
LSIFGLALVGLLGCSGDSGERAPRITLTASPEVITLGESTELQWQVTGSDPLTLRFTPELDDLELGGSELGGSEAGSVERVGSATVSPQTTTTYTLTADNPEGNQSRSVTVRVVSASTPTLASFEASVATGPAPLDVTLSWTFASTDPSANNPSATDPSATPNNTSADAVISCTVNPGDGSSPLELANCLDVQSIAHTYLQVGTYIARLELANGDTREVTVVVSADATDGVNVGGFIDEQSRNVIVILTGDEAADGSHKVDGLTRLNNAIAQIEGSRGVTSPLPAVRGLNAAVLSLLAGQQSETPQTTISKATLVDLASEYVVAVTAQGEVVATSPLERPDNSSQLQFDLDLPAKETVALLIAEPDAAGGWICKGTLEYQTLDGPTTTSSTQTLYRFPASLLNSEALNAGRFQFNELTAELASRLTASDASTMQRDLPSDAVQAAIIAVENAPDFADGVYQLCNNPRARLTDVRAQLELTGDRNPQTEGEVLYDFAMALLLETSPSTTLPSTTPLTPLANGATDQNDLTSINRLVGTAPIDAAGNISMRVVHDGSQTRDAELFLTDVAFFDARKQEFPLTPTYQFDATAQFTARAEATRVNTAGNQARQQDTTDVTNTDVTNDITNDVIDLGTVRAGLAAVQGQVLDVNFDPVANANVIIVLDGQRLAFNVAIADADGRYELLVPVDTRVPYILYAESPDGSIAGLASNNASGVRFEVNDTTSITQDIILDVALPAEPQPSDAPPSVSAGADITAPIGTPVRLRGQASDADGDTLTLTWQVLEQPANSSVTLTPLTGETTRFTPDLAGIYRVRFSAFDGQNFASDVVIIEATEADVLPVVDIVPLAPLSQLVEGAAATRLELARSSNFDSELTVELVRSSTTTASPEDLELVGATPTANGYSVTFAAGSTNATLDLRALEDNLSEDPELFVLNVQAAANIRLGSVTEASFVITDTDPDSIITTCEGDFEVLSRADLAGLANCRTITGNLTIRATDLVLLTELSNLSSVGGALQILATNLEGLEGLGNLLAIGGNLELSGNTSLISLAELSALTNIGGNVYIGVTAASEPAENSVLADIRALADVSVSGDTRVISNNPTLDCPAQGLEFELTISDANLADCHDNQPKPVRIDTFTTASSVIEAGGSSLLTWTVSGALPRTLTLTAEDELGEITVTDVSGQSGRTVTPETTTTYTLQAENEVNNNINTDTAELRVSVTVDPICDDDYVVTSSADLAALQNCTEITGRLEITGIGNVDLSPLAGLTTLGGDLVINANATLNSLAGLEDVTSIGGNLAVVGNASLTSLTALSKLESLGGSLIVTNNPSLANLAALPQLTTVGSSLIISDNSGLTSLQGLNTLTLIQGNLELAGNDLLTNLNGLDNLASLGGSLYIGYDTNGDEDNKIRGNPRLTDLSVIAGLTDGLIGGEKRIITGNAALNCPAQNLQFGVSLSLDNLADCLPAICNGNITVTSQTELTALNVCTEITGSLRIGADDITNLDALNRLERIGSDSGGDLRIGYLQGDTPIGNPQLTSLAGLSQLVSVTGDVVVRDNPQLDALIGLGGVNNLPGSLELTNNVRLTGLTGLSIARIAGDLSIVDNTRLVELTELAPLTDADVLGSTTVSGNSILDCLAQNLQFTVDSSRGNRTNCNDIVLEVCDRSYTITTAVQLARLEVCSEITGDLVIGPSTDIITLAPLSNVDALGGSLRIEDNSALTMLSGLGSVRSIADDVVIRNNPLLTSTGSLQRVNTLRTLTLDNNDSLGNLNGLQGLTELTDIAIINNSALTNLDGLENLATINGNIDITANSSLVSLTALAELTEEDVAGLITISDNLSLNCPAQGLQVFVDVSTGNALDCGICVLPAGFEVFDAAGLAGLALCRTIVGDLVIADPSDISDLVSLQNLERIEGNFTVDNSSNLTSLNGLDNLAMITGDLALMDNADLSDISALNSIPMTLAATSQITVTGNPLLVDLNGLQGSDQVGSLRLVDTELTNLTGLENLTRVNGGVTLLNNTRLGDVSALGSLTVVDSSLTITDNPLLTDLTGLDALASVGNNLVLTNNGLTTLTGLGTLASVGGDLTVADHTGLEDLSAFTNLTTVTGDITINNNDDPLFTTLAGLGGLTAYDDASYTVTVSDNDNLDCLLPPTLPFIVDVSVGNSANCTRVCTGPRTITNQAELINFAAELCREVTGDFNVVGSNDITTLTPLIELQTVSGNVVISNNTSLVDDDGLNNLANVGGDLIITNNAVLGGISRLNNVPPGEALLTLNPSSQLIVRGNPSLTTLNGLQGVTTLARLVIDATNLTTLEGLNNLVTVSGSLELTNNSNLIDVSSLSSLDTVGGNATITNNASLPNFAGMTNLTSISGDLTLTNNALTTLTGLTGLDTIGGNLQVNDNANLTTLLALNNLTTLDGGISVDNNDMLTTLDGLDSINGYDDSNTVSIQNNDMLDCSATPSLPFMVDVSSGNSVNCVMACPGATVTDQTGLNGLALCREITGDLVINGSNDIVTLGILANLESLTGDLVITNNTALQNINGLDNLASVGGNLQVTNNPALDNLNALASVPTSFPVTTQLTLISNGLTDILGLVGISAAQNIQIRDNALTTLVGLNDLGTVSGNLDIADSTTLADLNALSNLTTVGGNVRFAAHTGLTNFTGLGGLTNIGGNLTLELNPFITTLAGFDGLDSIGGNLIIDDNDNLASLAALTGLTTVDGNITINGNDDASFINLDGLQNIAGYDDPVNTVTITNNPNLDCSLIQPLPFEVDVSTGNSIDCQPAFCMNNQTINSQAQLNTLNVCTDIAGDLTIENSINIFNLNALTNLTMLSGDLVIDNNAALTDISGLSNLTNFGGDDLRISNNTALTSLVGLAGITNVSDLNISNNSVLPNLTGLNNLTTVTDTFLIQDNPDLTTLAALSNVNSVALGEIIIDNNDSLANLVGLGGINTVPGDLLLTDNDDLTNFVGLGSIITVPGDLWITGSASLANLAGLDSVSTIGGELRIENNLNLASFAALSSLTTVGGNITIVDNPDMSLTSLDGLQNITGYDDGGNTVTLTGNTNLDCMVVTPPFIVDVEGSNATMCP